MSIQLRQLQAFKAVAQIGSITKAAKEMGISQPAVSRLLRSFAESVDFELFQKKNGRLTPTQESRYLLGEVKRLLESLDHITELKKDLTDRKAGHLRIACLPGFATSHLPEVLAKFLKPLPAVTVTVEPDRPERILEWIIGEQYDFGITDGFTGHPGINSQILSLRTVCILPKQHKLASKKEIYPEDLVNERLIHTRRDSPFFKSLEKTFIDRGLIIPSWIEIRQFTAACMLVAEGLGVSIVSELDTHGYERSNLIIKPFLPQTPHEIALLLPIHSAPSMITLDFIEAFTESLDPYILTSKE